MLAGIVRGIGTVKTIEGHGGLRTFSIELPDGFSAGIETGASVSGNGMCLSMTAIHSAMLVDFDVVMPSLRMHA